MDLVASPRGAAAHGQMWGGRTFSEAYRTPDFCRSCYKGFREGQGRAYGNLGQNPRFQHSPLQTTFQN